MQTRCGKEQLQPRRVFAPGCALLIYKPELAKRLLKFLNDNFENIPEHLTCCKHEPRLEKETQVINVCPGCDRRYRELYDGISTISLWEILASCDNFQFPDYKGKIMAIHDACPTRTEARVQKSIRALLNKMNIKIIEPKYTQEKSVCCGDDFYGKLPVDKLKEQMRKRAAQMPLDDVVVYCVSCVKSMYIGGKKPRYIIDLLFNEDTIPGITEPDLWHAQIDAFIKTH